MMYTAVYNSAVIKGIEYTFDAFTDKDAKQFALWKFKADNILIVNEYAERYIRIGETEELERIYEERHGAE